MQGFNIGDKVSVLNETIKGKITKINFKKCTIEDTDGFVRYYSLSNIVVTQPYSDYKLDDERTIALINQKVEALAISQIEKLNTEVKHSKIKPIQYNFEIDLHIEELIDDHIGLSNFEIMQYQMQACRMFMEKAIRLKTKKVILIHGKGEGVLKHEIYSYLDRLENTKHLRFEYSGASFTKYGTEGATEVKIL